MGREGGHIQKRSAVVELEGVGGHTVGAYIGLSVGRRAGRRTFNVVDLSAPQELGVTRRRERHRIGPSMVIAERVDRVRFSVRTNREAEDIRRA